ncbi:MAG: hypothetical protein ACTSR2_00520 [Candidatus Hodarchaeales archaeon]
MKIYIPQRAKYGIGGGWTFTRNIQKALGGKVQFVNSLEDCDIYFIPGSTLAERNEVKKVKGLKKKIVLRIDNVPRNSRNRNTGTFRLYDYSQLADEVIYQSEWARRWIYPFIKREGVIILNGTDETIFKPEGPKIPKEGNPQYLYSRYNRDETKRWERAWYDFQKIYYENPEAHLWIVGRFSPEQEKYHFDFFGGAEKRYRYFGVVKSPEEMAMIYRGADYLLYTYEMDACSNVLVEAIMCGMKIILRTDGMGSAWEIMKAPKEQLTLKFMGERYLEVFNKVLKYEQ